MGTTVRTMLVAATYLIRDRSICKQVRATARLTSIPSGWSQLVDDEAERAQPLIQNCSWRCSHRSPHGDSAQMSPPLRTCNTRRSARARARAWGHGGMGMDAYHDTLYAGTQTKQAWRASTLYYHEQPANWTSDALRHTGAHIKGENGTRSLLSSVHTLQQPHTAQILPLNVIKSVSYVLFPPPYLARCLLRPRQTQARQPARPWIPCQLPRPS